MRVLALVFLSFLALAGPAGAQTPVFDDPVGLIEYAYEPYRNGELASLETKPIYTPTLIELFAAAADDGRLTFDPFVNGTDYDLTGLRITAATYRNDDSSLVGVSFYNFGKPQRLVFTLVRRVEGWKIDDIESVQPGLEWRLSEILAADPLLN